MAGDLAESVRDAANIVEADDSLSPQLIKALYDAADRLDALSDLLVAAQPFVTFNGVLRDETWFAADGVYETIIHAEDFRRLAQVVAKVRS